MPCARRALDRRRVKSIDIQLVAHFFQEAQLAFPCRAIRSNDIASHDISRFEHAIGQGFTDSVPQRVQSILFLK